MKFVVSIIRLNMPNCPCLSLGGKQLINWHSLDFNVIVGDQHLEKEVDESVCELEIYDDLVMEGGKTDRQFVRWQMSKEESSNEMRVRP